MSDQPTGYDDDLNYDELEAAYLAAQSSSTKPNLILIPVRTYIAARIFAGHKYPRKMKKWAIGTRKSLRRFCMRNAATVLGVK